LLTEGTDSKYGARHLKRAIERYLVQPLSNLIATNQVRSGDWVKVELEDEKLSFRREAEGLALHAMAEVAGTASILGLNAFTRTSSPELVRAQSARSSRRS
jgi:hypothetical protein